MRTRKNLPLWVKILVWSPLGLYLYPKYYWKIDKPDWFQILNGVLMGTYFIHIMMFVIKFFEN